MQRVAREIALDGKGVLHEARGMEGADSILVGDAGRHARTAVGVNVLPGNVAVEVDAIFEVR